MRRRIRASADSVRCTRRTRGNSSRQFQRRGHRHFRGACGRGTSCAAQSSLYGKRTGPHSCRRRLQGNDLRFHRRTCRARGRRRSSLTADYCGSQRRAANPLEGRCEMGASSSDAEPGRLRNAAIHRRHHRQSQGCQSDPSRHCHQHQSARARAFDASRERAHPCNHATVPRLRHGDVPAFGGLCTQHADHFASVPTESGACGGGGKEHHAVGGESRQFFKA